MPAGGSGDRSTALGVRGRRVRSALADLSSGVIGHSTAPEMERLKTLIAETAQRHEKEAKGLRKKGNAAAAALKAAFSEELYRVLGEFWMGPEATKDFGRILRGGK